MSDLSLVTIDQMVKEIESRTVAFICGLTLPDDKGTTFSYYGKGLWKDSTHLAAVLNNDVLNNWNNELKTLQRINEEKKEEE